MDIIILQLARKYTNEKISDALMSIYTLAGPITFSQLPPLTKEYLGFVHEITEDFTTTSDFIEGAGKTFPKGTNVSVCNAGTKTNPIYKYDASIGDLSAFQTKKLSQPIGGKTTVESLLSALNSGKADKVVPSVAGNFASLDSNGNLTDSGKSASDYYTKSEIDTLLASYLRLE